MTTTYGTSPGPVYAVTENTLFGVPLLNSNVTITNTDGTTTTISSVPDGNILTPGNSFNLSIASALFGQTFVVVPGASGTITIVASLATLTDNTFYIGGTANIDILASVLSGSTLNVDGGTATLSTGTIAGALSGSTINLTNGGTFAAGYGLISALNASTIAFGTGGGTLIVNAGGALIDLSSTTINNYNPNLDTIEFQDTTAPVSGYVISGTGTSRTIELLDANGNEIGTYTANLASGVTLADGPYNISDPNSPLKISYSNGNTYVGACFLPGTMIRTPTGDVAVEDIRIGDTIMAFDWQNNTEIAREVTWVGQARCTVRPHLPADEAGWPVRVLKNAVADGVPSKDMLITPEHCLFFDGKFVPVRMLVNGRSIFYDKSIASYTYYHVETEPHSVIWADDMLTESYLDTGNRASFSQHGKLARLCEVAARNWAEDAGATLDVRREFVEPLFHTLQDRASGLCPQSQVLETELTQDPDLHLITDSGQVIRKVREKEGFALFMLPAGVKTVRLVSRAGRPADVTGPFVDDRRQLGVLVGEIRLHEAGSVQSITCHLGNTSPNGWHGSEDGTRCWTNGDAMLPLDTSHRPCNVALLAVQIMAAGPYVMDDMAYGTESLTA